MSEIGEYTDIYWNFRDRRMEVILLGQKVAYSFTCPENAMHEVTGHTITCLWIWHDCDMHLARAQGVHEAPKHTEKAYGWKPAGIAAHELVSVSPLHIEPSVYWPRCCGMHGFIRDGVWVDA